MKDQPAHEGIGTEASGHVRTPPSPRPAADDEKPGIESGGRGPQVELRYLETLWLQVAGTLCNLACRHCFISCGPKNESHALMGLDQVAEALEEARGAGVKEVYFTGGEPFMHPEIFTLIDMALEMAPLTILTNGLLIDEDVAERLHSTFQRARYSLDLRVSLDGTSAATNDPIRGRGSFQRIMAGLRALGDAKLNPVITVTEVDDQGGSQARAEFRDLVRDAGLAKPRLKFLAPFRIGREARRGREYASYERLLEGDLLEGDDAHLQCSSCRAVTAKGVYPCPILVEVDQARLGDELGQTLHGFEARYSACYTCHVEGVSCRT